MDDVEKIKQKIDVVQLISEYFPLKQLGRNFKRNCPFHTEKTASFVVSPERQIWHCFGCGKGGDIFTFLMEYEKIDFSEAIKFLAQKAGVTLSGPVASTESEKKKELCYTLNHLSATFYHFLLTKHPIGKQALSYLLEKRKIPEALAEKFNIGFAPSNGHALTNFLMTKKGYATKDLLEAGLVATRDGRVFDFFRNRLIFPIMDSRGNVIAFSGRALSDQDIPKYINTRETPVYKKGDTLFGLYFAKDEIRKQNRAILVEGEFDVLSSFKEGIQNIVAIKGTALTLSQIKVLKRYAEKISFCFDTDAAGEEAQMRSIRLIEQEGVSASVIIPPLGKDPDELLKEDPILFKKAIKEDVGMFDYLIDKTLSHFDVTDAFQKRKVLERILPVLTLIENEVIKEHYFRKLAEKLNTSYDSLVKQSEKIREEKSIPSALQTNVKKPQKREERTDQYLISLLVQHQNPKEAYAQSKKILEKLSLSTPSFARLYSYLGEFFETGKVFSSSDFSNFLPTELVESFDLCFIAPLPHLTDTQQNEEINKASKEARELSIRDQLRRISDEISEKEKSGGEEELQILQQKFTELASLLNNRHTS